jgi:hypothetical protein
MGDKDPLQHPVYSIEDYRERAQPLPEHLWEEMAQAAAAYDELLAGGRRLRFEAPRDGGRVRATLTDLEGRVIRDVELADALELRV